MKECSKSREKALSLVNNLEWFALRLAEKDSEIAALKAKKGVIKDFCYELCLH